MIGTAVSIAGIVVAAPCLDGGLGALYDQTGLGYTVIGLIDGLVAALGAVAEIGVGLYYLYAATLVEQRTETYVSQFL